MGKPAGLPTKVKIGALTYPVVVCKSKQNDRGDPIFGFHDSTRVEIEIYPDGVAANQVALTLLHEIFHAIYHDRNLPDKREELIVDQLSAGVAQFMRDNPGAVRWIMEMLDG